STATASTSTSIPSRTSGMSSVACRPIPRISSMNFFPTSGSPRTLQRGEGRRLSGCRGEPGAQPGLLRVHPRPSMLEQPPGLSWRAHFRAMVGLVRVGPERRRPGVGPGRDSAGWCGGAPGMDEVTSILSAIEQGDPHAAEQLLPLVYDELRELA